VKIPHLIFVTLLTLFTQLYAQEAAKRDCRILFLERPATAPKSLHLFDGSTSQQVDLPNMNLSAVYEIASNATQIKLLPEKVDNPDTIPPEAPSVELPAEYKNILLIISSDPDNKIAPVKLTAINLTFKISQTLWINRTDKTIEGKLGEQVLSLEPDSSKITDAPLGNQSRPTSGYFEASFTYRIQGSDVSSPITEQQWWHDANSRHIGVVANSGGKLPKINFFRDFREPESNEKAVK
jgi:hypothetical protein